MRHVWRSLLESLSIGGLALAVVVGALALAWELRTCDWQAHYLSQLGNQLRFQLQPGPSASIRFPSAGPYDVRLGYVRLPEFIRRLRAQGFEITAQARFSPMLTRLTDLGLFTIYHEKTQAGLQILGRDNEVLFSAVEPARVYPDFTAIPPLVVRTLLFIENRELLDDRYPERNPAVEWDRFGRAVLEEVTHRLGSSNHVPGGSTLATQLEKYRHSPEGRTGSVVEKLRQMASAAVRAYLDGPNTTDTRRDIAVAYLNSMPLSAVPGYGEVNGLGDGLWIWYGADFGAVNRLLRSLTADSTAPGVPVSPAQAAAYREALTLMLAQRRPAYYLRAGRADLQSLADNYLRVLASSGVITPALCDAALRSPVTVRTDPVSEPSYPYATHKAESVLRARLAGALGEARLYDLDRLDLTVKSTLDQPTQRAISETLRKLNDPAYVRASGLVGFRLLGERDDLSRIIYSFTLYERGATGNLLRVQTDNYDQPLDVNEGIRLDLGSTAKLRTLVLYLQIMADLYQQYRGQPPQVLRKLDIHHRDHLSRWVIDQLQARPAMSLRELLDAALQRRYSASPGEAFFTGGGIHTFVNFDKADNHRILSVRDALQNSVNLVFIRLMRDIVYYYLYKPGAIGRELASGGDPLRRQYLQRFADEEGKVFLRRFYAKHRGKTPKDMLAVLVQGVNVTPWRLATIYRSLYPQSDAGALSAYLRSQRETAKLSDEDIEELYRKYSPQRFNLQDRGYLAHIHPLELWLVGYLIRHPRAGLSEAVAASVRERQEVYAWLFKTRRRWAQDKRIQSLLEVQAFAEIHAAWKRLGYPFESLTPSYACAIGASGDRPAALAELIGILLNDGMRYPMVRFESARFAAGTPYETLIGRPPARGQRVLPAEVAAAARSVLAQVVDHGTAVRLKGAYKSADGKPLMVGGKTGTGDQRREIFGSRGRVIETKVLNRTATFAFMLGERFFGTLTAYVGGAPAAHYHFTSALPVQVLKSMEPTLAPVLARAGSEESKPSVRTSLARTTPRGGRVMAEAP
jgi:membrane peptidoglycan carboxypeptidase